MFGPVNLFSATYNSTNVSELIGILSSLIHKGVYMDGQLITASGNFNGKTITRFGISPNAGKVIVEYASENVYGVATVDILGTSNEYK